MAVIGQRNPNELVVYTNSLEFPSFIRRSYVFKGLGENGSGSYTTLGETQIAAQARSASGDPLPPSNELAGGLPQTRVSVRRYDRQRGHATIVVQWGIRYTAGGSGADVKREASRIVNTRQAQPYAAITRGDNISLFEILSRQIFRPTVRVRFEKVRTDDGTTTGLVDKILGDAGKLILWRGQDRIIVSGGFSPFSQTQGYLSITMDLVSGVAAVPEDGIIADTGVYGSLPVVALARNQEYGVPSTSTGTPALPLPVSVPVYNWMVS